MSSNALDAADDLQVTEVSGYKAGEKKTAEELAALDANDESLKKWKESLGLKVGEAGASGDPRKVVVLYLALEVPDREEVVMALDTPEKISALESAPIVIKEGVDYNLKIKFKIQHDVISGLKYLHSVKRAGIKVDRMEEMVGSYGPNPEPYEKKFPTEEAPSGMLARGRYTVHSKFVDDDKVTHLEWKWSFDIKKDWSGKDD